MSSSTAWNAVYDEPIVRHVVVHVVDDVPPALRYVVRVLDRQARTLGKSVEFTPPAA